MLAIAGTCYYAGAWVDKLTLWWSPEATVLANGLRLFPDYDGSMAIATLFLLPTVLMFIRAADTRFFARYRQFFADIFGHRPLSRIYHRKGELIACVHEGTRQLALLQGVLTLTGLMCSGAIIVGLHARPESLLLFRMALIGGFFHVLMLFALVMLAYFDCTKQMLLVALTFLICNLVVTLITLETGYYTYGFGFCAASVFGFVLAISLLFAHLRNLTYHSVIGGLKHT